ncbi:hypothetical protein ACQ5TV_10440 [Acetobacter ghanensis]|uniref:hypothetical protein n=1 Tax=Acetobacter ghanensis TaxID=431306 RepID=UPI003D33EE31
MTGNRSALLISCAALFFSTAASAHRLDEYLQATTINVTRHHITLHLRLTPGVDVAPSVMRQIDQNNDGQFSMAEQQAYRARLLQSLTLTMNGKAVALSASSMTFPPPQSIQKGTGVIDLQLNATAELTAGTYTLVYHNRGMGAETAWLVNCLVPQDPDIHVVQQTRSADQSRYTLQLAIAS